MATVDEFAIPTTILRHFDLASTPWTELSSPQIEERRRRSPEGKLFFDRLLELTGLDGPSLYPPNTPAALRRLLHAIYSCPFDRLKRDCLLYYLLKDYDAATSLQAQPSMDIDDALEIVSESNGGKAEAFVKRRCLPRTWKVFMDGYWALDHALWEVAVSSLSDPSITTLNFVPSILSTLAAHVSPPSHSLSLIHSFLISARPELTTSEERDIRLIALTSAGSVSQAFGLIRSIDSADERGRMRELVWCWILGAPRTPCGAGEHGVQSKSLRELLHLPLAAEEDKHLIDFLSRPPRTISPPALSLLHDLVTLRLIHQGQYQDSLQLDKQLAGSGGKQEDKQRRREMVREFIAILPEAQRRALLVDAEITSKHDDAVAPTPNGNGAADNVDMSSSWVQVTHPAPSTSNATYAEIASEPPSQPIPSAIAAPTPIRAAPHVALANVASAVPLPASPARGPSSPFSGPPRFAPGSSNANPSPRRVLSGSPFNPPPSSSTAAKSKGSPAPIPRLPRTVINDDEDDDDDSVLGRRSKATSKSRFIRAASKSVEPEPRTGEDVEPDLAEEKMAIDENHPISPIAEEPAPPQPSTSLRKSRRATSYNLSRQARLSTPPPSPPANGQKPARSRSTAAVPVTPGPVNGMPGAFNRDSEDEMPPPRSRASSNVPESGRARSRITRSASRAILDEEDQPTPGPPSKKTRSTAGAGAGKGMKRSGRASMALSEVDDGHANGSVRRSTRSMTAGPSEQGSPTPSVAQSDVSVASRRRTRTGREGSATPRMSTRSKRG